MTCDPAGYHALASAMSRGDVPAREAARKVNGRTVEVLRFVAAPHSAPGAVR